MCNVWKMVLFKMQTASSIFQLHIMDLKVENWLIDALWVQKMQVWLCHSERKQRQACEMQKLSIIHVLELYEELESWETLSSAHSDMQVMIIVFNILIYKIFIKSEDHFDLFVALGLLIGELLFLFLMFMNIWLSGIFDASVENVSLDYPLASSSEFYDIIDSYPSFLFLLFVDFSPFWSFSWYLLIYYT